MNLSLKIRIDLCRITSLASAIYLEKDAGVPGSNIHILEKSNIAGLALDGPNDTVTGFVARGGRMHELHYTCYWDKQPQSFI